MLLVHVPRSSIEQRAVTECIVRDAAASWRMCEGLLASKRPGARATIRQVIGEGDFRLWNIPLKVPVMHILQDLQNQ